MTHLQLFEKLVTEVQRRLALMADLQEPPLLTG